MFWVLHRDSPIDPAAAVRNPTSDHGLASAPDTSILNETFFTDDSAVVSDQQDVKGTGEHGVLPKPSPLKGTDAAKSTRPGMGKNGISKANLPNEEAKRDGGKLEHAEETRGKNGGERENQRKDEKADTLENETQGKEPGKGKGDKHKHTKKAEKDKHRRKQVQTATCRSECWGLKPGYYPSCRGCQYYILCTKYGRKLERRCQRNGQWDDDHKKCRKRSSTCIHEADNSGK
ncbi:hypothetical protein BaRGS_00008918 [Batillaria attramentaria]|uniref:Chitin-binding type-2 domain-containing protein n=1 Tax=Batillaria attramentaria TaxID=370345 RepID=A0ABD0LLG6_9CAEN